MAEFPYLWEMAGFILGIFALGMTFFIWHNQDKAAKQTRDVINKIDGITTKVDAFNERLKEKMESAKLDSFMTVHFYLSASFRLLNEIYVGVRNLDNDSEGRLKYFRGKVELLTGILGSNERLKRELDFLKGNYTKEYLMLNEVLLLLSILKHYGENVAINQKGLDDWLKKCFPTLEKSEELLDHLYGEIKSSPDT